MRGYNSKHDVDYEINVDGRRSWDFLAKIEKWRLVKLSDHRGTLVLHGWDSSTVFLSSGRCSFPLVKSMIFSFTSLADTPTRRSR